MELEINVPEPKQCNYETKQKITMHALQINPPRQPANTQMMVLPPTPQKHRKPPQPQHATTTDKQRSQNTRNSNSPPRQNLCHQKHCQSKTNTPARIHKTNLVFNQQTKICLTFHMGQSILTNFACMMSRLSKIEKRHGAMFAKLQIWETIKNACCHL
jgi:hypothetical protein